MSRHEGVSCDFCLKGNFKGRRYKCLVCYDYDLCGPCYDVGATTIRHTTEHPMQCILTRNDLETYYGGEGLEQQQSFTCPFCGKMGYTETTLHEHVTEDHEVSSLEVVCPICAAQPGGDPNLITDDLASHLSLEHRSGTRDLISFLDEPASSSSSRHPVRRIPHSTRGTSRGSRRSNMHFSSANNATSSSALSARDSVDPIAELLSQLSGVRRSNSSSNSSSQLAHIQMQLQLERQQVRAARQQLERLPRRQTQSSGAGANHTNHYTSNNQNSNVGGTSQGDNTATSTNGQKQQHEFLLSKKMTENLTDKEKEQLERDKYGRAAYMQELLLSSLMKGIQMGPNSKITHLLPQFELLPLKQKYDINKQTSSSDELGVTNVSIGEDTIENKNDRSATAARQNTSKNISKLNQKNESCGVMSRTTLITIPSNNEKVISNSTTPQTTSDQPNSCNPNSVIQKNSNFKNTPLSTKPCLSGIYLKSSSSAATPSSTVTTIISNSVSISKPITTTKSSTSSSTSSSVMSPIQTWITNHSKSKNTNSSNHTNLIRNLNKISFEKESTAATENIQQMNGKIRGGTGTIREEVARNRVNNKLSLNGGAFQRKIEPSSVRSNNQVTAKQN